MESTGRIDCEGDVDGIRTEDLSRRGSSAGGGDPDVQGGWSLGTPSVSRSGIADCISANTWIEELPAKADTWSYTSIHMLAKNVERSDRQNTAGESKRSPNKASCLKRKSKLKNTTLLKEEPRKIASRHHNHKTMRKATWVEFGCREALLVSSTHDCHFHVLLLCW